MRIVKLKTNHGRVLYAIQTRAAGWFRPPTYLSLVTSQEWTKDENVLLFCSSVSLELVQDRFLKANIPEEKIVKVIKRKCTCK